jgi:hypothetical protein
MTFTSNQRKRLAIAAFLTSCTLTGCLTEKKVSRWNQEHPRQAAEYCAEKFPAQIGDTITLTRSDSTDYLQYIADLEHSVQDLNAVNDSLIFQALSADTSCRRYWHFFSNYRSSVDGLLQRLNKAPPVIIYRDKIVPIKDSAKAVADRLTIDELSIEKNVLQKDLIRVQATSKVRLWMLIASCVLNMLLAVLLFKRSSIKI